MVLALGTLLGAQNTTPAVLLPRRLRAGSWAELD